jgi:hypothetical protein
LNIELLPHGRWEELREVFDREFNAELPSENHAEILFKANEDGKIQSFAVVETLIRIGQFHTLEKVAGQNVPLKILKYLLKNIPKGASVIAVDDDGRFGGLARKFGMYERRGTIYRRDF